MTTSWRPRLKGGGRHSQPNDQVEAKRCEKFDVSAPVMAVVIIAMDFQQQLIRRRPGSRLEQSNNYHLVHSLSSSSANNDSNIATRHEFGVPLSPFCDDGLFEAPRNKLARGLAWVHLKAEEKTRFLTFPMIAHCQCPSREAIKWRFVWCDCSVFKYKVSNSWKWHSMRKHYF